MKRLRSYGEDLDDVGGKDWERREMDSERSSSRRRFYGKEESLRRSFSSLYDRSIEEDREAMRPPRKRFEHETEGYDRRKMFDRHRDSGGGGGSSGSCVDRPVYVSSSRSSYGSERMHRSESFSSISRDFPKGFRSERDRSRRDGCGGLSWRRLSCGREATEDEKTPPRYSEGQSKTRSLDSSCGELPKEMGAVKVEMEKVQGQSSSSSEMEEGELEPDPIPEPSTDTKVQAEGDPEPENETKCISESSSENKSGSFGGTSGEERPVKIEVDQVTVNVSMQGCKDENDDLPKALDEETGGKVAVECNEQRESLAQRESEDLAEGICKEEKVEDTYYGVKRKQIISVGSSCLPLQVPNLQMKHDFETHVANDDELSNFYTSLEANLEDKVREVRDRVVEEDAENKIESDINIGFVLNKDKGIDQLDFEGELNQGKCVDVQATADDESGCFSSVKESTFVMLKPLANKKKENPKDKGKSIARTFSNVADSVDGGDPVEGPSCRGFELVFRDHIAHPDTVSSCGLFAGRITNKKLKLEPLDLSLGLPGVLPDQNFKPPNTQPCSPGLTRSFQSFPSSFRTTSDGFTNSISFSSSQPFVHNPSCSLTHNTMDNFEQSVGSHPIFHGVDQLSSGTIWPSQSIIEPKWKGSPGTLFQRVLMNGNHSQNSVKVMNGHHDLNSNALVRQPSFPRQASPPQSIGSHDMMPEHSKDKKTLARERSFNSIFRSEQREGEDIIISALNVIERIIPRIVFEPLQVMERMLQDMTENSIEYLKDSICRMLASTDKRGLVHSMQGALRRRSDLTAETMKRCPRTLLEILVALKTDLPDFLQKSNNASSSDLVEIFHNLKCRNIACRSPLPVDDCDCKICSQKDGFCSACMCLICSKFDMASNTCSWVGCDVCLHWCHTDCGLRGSHIRNGRSSSAAPEATEMQFHCVACCHPSEMFGFVKEVFKMCSKDWKVENLAKELQYVRRIFCGSNDVKGKSLYQVAGQMLVKLEDKKKHSEVIKLIMSYLSESESSISSIPSHSPKETSENNALTFPREDTAWSPRVSSPKASRVPHKNTTSNGGDDQMRRQRTDAVVSPINSERKPVADELEIVVGFKQAEAKMYQERADNARRESDGLKRIAAAKNGEIEDEYSTRVAKLRVQDTEEKRRRNLEELEEIERAHRDFLSLKARMETDIKELLLKIEAARRNVNG